MKRTIGAAAAALLGALSVAHAADAPNASPFDTHPGQFVQLANQHGFIVGVCKRDRSTLVEEMRYRHQLLDVRERQLHDTIGTGSLTAGDIALTILMPGGLIYAAQRHDAIRRAQATLVDVERRAKELSAEMRAFTSQDSAALSASLH